MLSKPLIDVVNSGGAWAFLGGGISAAAGFPTWSVLLEDVLQGMQAEDADQLLADKTFSSSRTMGDFPRCFSLVEAQAGRPALVGRVRDVIAGVRPPGDLHRDFASWRFAGYVTTNYDLSIEHALEAAGELGWLTVGNNPGELNLLSGDPQRVVWHPHGHVREPMGMVLTEEDYDRLYAEGNPVVEQLQGLLAQRRVIFAGFGFGDEALNRVLRHLKPIINPARPPFCFLGGATLDEQSDLTRRFGLHLIPYRDADGSHQELVELVRLHGHFVVPRSLRFGRGHIECPSWDAEATGLLIYNNLVLKSTRPPNVASELLRALALALVHESGTSSAVAVSSELSRRAQLMVGSTAEGLALSAIDDLVRDGLLVRQDGSPEGTIAETELGEARASEAAAEASRLALGFTASLSQRAGQHVADNESAHRIALAVETFLKDSIDKRSVAVALVQRAPSADVHEYQTVGLLQSLPDYLESLTSITEAIVALDIILDVISKPSDAERDYIGLAVQTRFGIHLLGVDPDTLAALARDFSNTVFLLDATTLIPLVAVGSPSHEAAALLISTLRDLGNRPVTTPLFVTEVAEHAEWALRSSDMNGAMTPELLAAAGGQVGGRGNEFLDGFVESVAIGACGPDIDSYVEWCLGSRPAVGDVTPAQVTQALERYGVQVARLEDWTGCGESHVQRRTAAEVAIAAFRAEKRTFTHPRQVSAEGEALAILEGASDGTLRSPDKASTNAGLFVSTSAVLDATTELRRRICIRPENALRWALALKPLASSELGGVSQVLFWELSRSGATLIDERTLSRAFAPLITAARSRLGELLEDSRQEFIARFGEEGVAALQGIEDLAAPMAVDFFEADRIRQLEERMRVIQGRADAAAARQGLTDVEHAELERLRAKEDERRRRARSRVRAAESRPRRRKRRKKQPGS